MSRHSDRFMTGAEWDKFVADVETGADPEKLREDYGLSKRNTIRSVRRAQKQLGVTYTLPPEDAQSREAEKGRKRREGLAAMSPVRRATTANDWSYLTPMEKAGRLLGNRIGTRPNGDYTLDGRPVNFKDILIVCNRLLAVEGLDQLPGPGVFIDPNNPSGPPRAMNVRPNAIS